MKNSKKKKKGSGAVSELLNDGDSPVVVTRKEVKKSKKCVNCDQRTGKPDAEGKCTGCGLAKYELANGESDAAKPTGEVTATVRLKLQLVLQIDVQATDALGQQAEAMQVVATHVQFHPGVVVLSSSVLMHGLFPQSLEGTPEFEISESGE